MGSVRQKKASPLHNRVGWLSPPGRRAKPSSTSEVWRSLFESVALQSAVH